MKKKNVILMASLSLFAMNCSTLQENLSSKKRNNKVKTDSENADATASKKEDDREHKSDNQNLKNRFSNDSLVITKINELQEKNQRLLISGTSSEIRTVKLQNALLKSFENWKGTRYAFGGDSSRGIDCSALTRRVYREVFSFELPRVTKDQIKVGRHVSRNNLKPGDILYFRPDGKYNHTAVYLGNSLFINASSSKGVILSSMEHSYWSKYFVHGVRVDTASANV
jgi:Cell wall-associated hydrolases (invasion-associated proteins)